MNETSNGDVPSIRAETVSEQIAKYLGDQMLTGLLKPGEQIVEQRVAELFDVSRGPVRDALRILENQGLVRIEARRGTYVTELTLNDVIDLFNIRTVLLGLAVRYIAIAQDRKRIAELDVKLKDLANAVDDETMSAADFMRVLGRLGSAMLKATPSEPLVAAFNGLSHATIWIRIWEDHAFAYETQDGRRKLYEGYRPVFDAIRAGKPDLAAIAYEKFSIRVRDEMVEVIRAHRTEAFEDFRLRCF